MPQDIVQPLNTVIVSDDGLVIEEFEIGQNATVADMIPGTAVIYDAAEGAVKEAGAKAHGVIGWLMEMPDQDIDTAYAARGDPCRVITGGNGKILVRRVANAGNITEGSPVVTAANGLADIQAVGAAGTQGDVCAIGAQTLADSTAIARIVVKVHGQAENKAAT